LSGTLASRRIYADDPRHTQTGRPEEAMDRRRRGMDTVQLNDDRAARRGSYGISATDSFGRQRSFTGMINIIDSLSAIRYRPTDESHAA
jgi:hypothetical protein